MLNHILALLTVYPPHQFGQNQVLQSLFNFYSKIWSIIILVIVKLVSSSQVSWTVTDVWHCNTLNYTAAAYTEINAPGWLCCLMASFFIYNSEHDTNRAWRHNSRSRIYYCWNFSKKYSNLCHLTTSTTEFSKLFLFLLTASEHTPLHYCSFLSDFLWQE